MTVERKDCIVRKRKLCRQLPTILLSCVISFALWSINVFEYSLAHHPRLTSEWHLLQDFLAPILLSDDNFNQTQQHASHPHGDDELAGLHSASSDVDERSMVNTTTIRTTTPIAAATTTAATTTVTDKNENVQNAVATQMRKVGFFREPLEQKRSPQTQKLTAEQVKELQEKRRVEREKFIDEALAKNPHCQGKEKYIRIILGSKETIQLRGTNVALLCQKLPSQAQVIARHGEKPIIIGMDTCSVYRAMLTPERNNGTAYEPMPRVAGLYHTGTNALAQTLEINFKPLPSFPRATYCSPYEVPWGKHLVPDRHRLTNIFVADHNESRKHVLPIVIVRDPFFWMQSMCKFWYDVRWEKPLNNRCPAIVLDENSTTVYPTFAHTHQTHWQAIDNFTSLPDMWSEWNRQYYQADYPRLMVRFEDILYRLEEVVNAIRECIGQPSDQPLRYKTSNSKTHGKPLDFVSSLAKYVTTTDRHRGMEKADRRYANKALDAELMKNFQYEYAPLEVPKQDVTGPFVGPMPSPRDGLWWIPEDRRESYRRALGRNPLNSMQGRVRVNYWRSREQHLPTQKLNLVRNTRYERSDQFRNFRQMNLQRNKDQRNNR